MLSKNITCLLLIGGRLPRRVAVRNSLGAISDGYSFGDNRISPLQEMGQMDICKEKQMRLLYIGKAKDMTFNELWMLQHFGRKLEQLEDVDFSRN